MGKNEVCNNEESLIHALRKLHALFDGIGEPIYVLDSDTYEILFANKKLKELAGEKILGKKCYKVFHNLNHPCPSCNNKYIFGENLRKTYVWEYQNRKNKRWYKCVDKAIKWLANKYVHFGMAIDITENKQMEEMLRKSEMRHRALIENSSDIVQVVDSEGIIRYVSPSVERILGYKPEELIGRLSVEIVHPDDLPKVAKGFEEAIRKPGVSVVTACRCKHKDGTWRVIEGTGINYLDRPAVSGFISNMHDITERKKSEERIGESEEKYRKQFEEAMDAIVIADAETGTIVDCNRAASGLVDREKSELIGEHQRILHPPEKIEGEFSRTFKQHLKEEEGQVLETQVITKKGEIKDVAIKANVFELGGKKLLQGIFRDITERKRMEKERKLFEERLSALNKHGQSLNIADDIGTVLKLTLDVMEKTLGFEFADLFLVEGETLRLVAHRGFSKVLTLNLPLDGRRGVVVKAARLRKPVFIPDIRKERAYVEAGVEGMLSELAVPVKIKDKVLGVLNVESERLEAFDEKDGELLETLASHAAIAISNLKRQEKLSTLNIYGRDLNRAESLEDVYKVMLKAMEKTLGFEYASILMVEGKMLRLVSQRGYSNNLSLSLPLDGEKGVTGRAARTGKPVFVSDIRKEKTYVLGKPNMLSELAVPIKVEKEVLGVLNVESKKLAGFDEEDRELLEILASHAAIAISDIKRHTQLRKLSNRLANLMESSTEIMRKKDTHQRLKVIVRAIRKFGWRRVVISLRDENLEGRAVVTAGLAKEEVKLLLERKAPGHVWRERLGPKFERFKKGEFYYLPWSDPWIREYVHGVPPEAPLEEATTYTGVPSRLPPEEMVDWHPQDMLYAPLRTPAGRVVGILSMDDPVDGRNPTRESLTPLELFLHQAAIVIENAQLIESLREARKQLEAHAEQLEQKVEERTRELKKSQEQLLKAQRLAVIGELAGMVGHDLRNPLTSINGAAYYVKKRLSSKIDGKVKRMLDLIGKNIVYSNKIINDLLDYSREIKLDLTESNPKSIIKEALSLVEIPKKVQVIDLTDDKPKIKVDTAKIKRAFVNILKNAVEAMPKGGTLTTKSRKSDGNLEFVFSDTGVGISKKTMENLWTPLFTTKAKGMGFGLAICKRIVEAHEGSISVQSARGKGTIFIVTIPVKSKLEGGEKIWVKPLESSLLTTMKT